MNIAQSVDDLVTFDANTSLVASSFTPVNGVQITIAKYNPLRIYLALTGPNFTALSFFNIKGPRANVQSQMGLGFPAAFFLHFDINKNYSLTTTQWDFITNDGGGIIQVFEVLYGGH